MADKRIQELIQTRLPEFYQGDNNLRQYLEACGELFDELEDTIKLHDHYNDYRYVPESRLSMLARKFAFDPPRNIPDDLLRGIVRDIIGIYTTKGVEQSLLWVFRLLGWRATFEYAWLRNPERYDPDAREVFSELYNRDGLDSDISVSNSIIPRIGDGYEIGNENQTYVFDNNFYFPGKLLIGRNELTYTGSGDPYDPFTPEESYTPSTDFNKLDWRNFVYGESRVDPDGVYFYGRTPFSEFKNLRKLRILGESYKESQETRFRDVVMKTPYIIVEVNNQDYDRFTSPYEDEDGNVYSYTESETFSIAETLVNYFLYDSVRPSNVKIVLIATQEKLEDTVPYSDELTDEFTSEPIELEDSFEATDTTDDFLTVDGGAVRIGTTGAHIGSPSYMPVNSLSVVPMFTIGDTVVEHEFEVSSEEFTYSFFDEVLYNTPDNPLEFSTRAYPLRTPARFSIDHNVPNAVIQYKVGATDEFIDYGPAERGVYSFESHDMNYIRITTRLTESDLLGEDGQTLSVNFEKQSYGVIENIDLLDSVNPQSLSGNFVEQSYGDFDKTDFNSLNRNSTLSANFVEQTYELNSGVSVNISVNWEDQNPYEYPNDAPKLVETELAA